MMKNAKMFCLLLLSLLFTLGLTLAAASAHVHDWVCNTNGTHSCRDTSCGQQGVSCTFSTAPTCSTAQSCTVCRGGWKNLENHEGDRELIDVIAATCHYTGETGDLYCWGCKTYISYSEDTPIDPDNHNRLTKVGENAPSCIAGGNAAYWSCSGCKKIFADRGDAADITAAYDDASAFALPATGHDWQSNGNQTHSCRNSCGAAGDCSSAAPATCSREAECQDCGDKWKNPANHEGASWLVFDYAPTCCANGYTGDLWCEGCRSIKAYGYYIGPDASNHEGSTEIRGVIPATCCTAGYTGDTWCLGCERLLFEGEATPLDPANHDGETELRGIVPATCHTPGYSGDRICVSCDAVLESGAATALDPANHDGETELRGVVPATCHTPGYSGDRICVSCDAVLEPGAATPLDPANHDGETEYRAPIAATCHAPGYAGDVWCLGCETVIAAGEATPIDPANHEGATEIRGAKEPTLLEEGCTGDTWCLGCETLIATGEAIEKLPMEYWRMTVCSIGPRLREVTGEDKSWRMFTPIDLSQDGGQTFPLIAGDAHEIGRVTVTVAEGFVTLSRTYGSLDVWEQEAFMTLLPDADSLTAEALAEGGFAFDQPISIADDLGGDTRVLLVIRCEVIYPVVLQPLASFRADRDYLQIVEALMANMD